MHIWSFLNGLAKQGMGIPIGKLSLVRIHVHVFTFFWYLNIILRVEFREI
jgi:hypothetical protein